MKGALGVGDVIPLVLSCVITNGIEIVLMEENKTSFLKFLELLVKYNGAKVFLLLICTPQCKS